jgi:predicted nuclease of predicted toxin-antitoxin system
MTIWIDAQLSPFIASWINANFPELEAIALRSIGLQDEKDYDIFRKARKANAIIMSKDYDFVKLIEIYGIPPKLIWITCGNTSNARLCEILGNALQQAIDMLIQQEDIVEISDKLL